MNKNNSIIMKRNIFILMFLILLPTCIWAQEKINVKGVVYDDSKMTVPGASVVEKGTQNGTVTDMDGNFSLTVSKGATLEISFIGYKTINIKAADSQPLNIIIQEDSQTLDEVVVTGYGGRQLRTKLTNSIAKVKEENLQVGLFSNPAQALSGAVAGLKVTQSSGSPGATPTIVLRGGTNLDGTGSPLVLVDGQLRDGLNDINPEDIESMEVLKDAGATALYGARASNGVILVTTKNGRAGRREINLKVKLGLNYVNNPYEFLGGEDYIRTLRTTYSKSGYYCSDGEYVSIAPLSNLTGASPFGTGNVLGQSSWNIMGKTADNVYLLQKGWKEMVDPLDPSNQIIYKDINPADYNLNNPSFSQDYNINMSGGNDKGNYYAG